jgi:protein TonB
VSKVNPEYPAELKKERVEGSVSVRVVVDKAGAVTSATVRREDRPEFGRAAVAAVRQWRFEPGDAVVELTLTINFKLS